MTKWCVKDGVSEMVGDKVGRERWCVPLLEACKDINLMRVQNGLIEIKRTQKKQLIVLLLLSATTV